MFPQVEPFKGLPHQHLSSLAVFVRPISLEKGTVVFAEGQLADKLYVIREGEVRLLGRYADGVAGIQVWGRLDSRQAHRLEPEYPCLRCLGTSKSKNLKPLTLNSPMLSLLTARDPLRLWIVASFRSILLARRTSPVSVSLPGSHCQLIPSGSPYRRRWHQPPSGRRATGPRSSRKGRVSKQTRPA